MSAVSPIDCKKVTILAGGMTWRNSTRVPPGTEGYIVDDNYVAMWFRSCESQIKEMRNQIPKNGSVLLYNEENGYFFYAHEKTLQLKTL